MKKKCKVCKVYCEYKACVFEHNGDENICPFDERYLDLSKHDKQIRADTINEFVTRFEEEYSRIAVNLGEFRKYQYEMHRLAENMVKEQK